MLAEVFFCPYCSSELELSHYESMTGLKVYKACQCRQYQKKHRREMVKIDTDGFVIDPLSIRGRYLKTRPQT